MWLTQATILNLVENAPQDAKQPKGKPKDTEQGANPRKRPAASSWAAKVHAKQLKDKEDKEDEEAKLEKIKINKETWKEIESK